MWDTVGGRLAIVGLAGLLFGLVLVQFGLLTSANTPGGGDGDELSLVGAFVAAAGIVLVLVGALSSKLRRRDLANELPGPPLLYRGLF